MGKRRRRMKRRLNTPPPVVVKPPPEPVPPPSPTEPIPPAPPQEAPRVLYVEPMAAAVKQATSWRKDRPLDAACMDFLASQPVGLWLGDWTADPTATVDAALDKPGVRTLVLYNIPMRDMGNWSAGGVANRAAYEAWIQKVVDGFRGRYAIVVLEPDALPMLPGDLTADQATERMAMMKDAVNNLTAHGAHVYIDAGDSNWIPADTMARRLQQAGVDNARGFALNVSHTERVEDEVVYARAIQKTLLGKHFIIDTSRAGLGPAEDNEWCNPPGRALGPLPTLKTGIADCDAFLWVKPPGESDGSCNGGPKAGHFWAEYALGLVQRSAHMSGIKS